MTLSPLGALPREGAMILSSVAWIRNRIGCRDEPEQRESRGSTHG